MASLHLEKVPPEISDEVKKIVNRITSRRLQFFIELEKIVRSKNTKRNTKVAAFWLLGNSGGKKGFRLLKKGATDQSANIEDRQIAAWALSKFVNASVVRLLSEIFMNESDVPLIWEAAKGLAVNPKLAPFSLLVKCLKDAASPERREAAAWILGCLGNRRYARFLLSRLTDRKELPNVRGQAAESLGMLDYKKSVRELIKVLKDPSVEVRFWAAFALGQIGDTKAIPHLLHLAKTDKGNLRGWWSVAKEAKDAISSIKNDYKLYGRV